MNRTGRHALVTTLGAAGLAWAPEVLAQCAMCQTALTGSPEGQLLAARFNKAILVMMAAPYLVAASFLAVALRRTLRRQAATLAARLRPRLRLLMTTRTAATARAPGAE